MDQHRASLTFLFSDIEGSTRLWENETESMREAHARHLELIEKSVVAHGGRFIKSRGEGDSTFSVFHSAAGAVAAAIDAQKSLQHERWKPEVSLRVRMALHTGSAFELDGDYHSTDVNRCARLRGIAHGGQAIVSSSTRESALLEEAAAVKAEVFMDLGLHRLRDLQEPEHVYQLTCDGLWREFPPLESIKSQPNNLPRQLTSFVGREDEIHEVHERLRSNCLVTLAGVGGVGKTRLALQVAAEMLDSFRNGVWFVDLAALSDPAQVTRTVAAALGLREDPSRPIDIALFQYLSGREHLLVLDNCEHLLSACARFAVEVLRACPATKVLATSREPLGVGGEIVYRVPSLEVLISEPVTENEQRAATPHMIRKMMGYDSVRLFVERARMHQTRFEVTPTNAYGIIELCRQLDGIPLAIELAAARTRALSVEQILSRIGSRFQILASGDRSALDRHQTLRAMVDWSYDLLTPEEQVLLQRLSVFAAEFTLEDAEAVLADEKPSSQSNAIESWQVLDILTSLVDKSLLNYERVVLHDNEFGRYRALETMRQYGREKLEKAGEANAVRARHCDYFLRRVEDQEQLLPGSFESLEGLQTIQGEVRAALEFCETGGQPGTTERELRFCAVLWFFWIIRAYYREGNKHLERALSREDAALYPAPYGKAMVGSAALAYYLCDHERCVMLCHQALPICREQRLHFHAALCLVVLATYAFVTGDVPEAEKLWRESYALSEKAGDPWVRSLAATWLGDIALARGDQDAAMKSAEEGLALARISEEAYVTFHALFHLGLICNALGSHDRARETLQEALLLCHRTRHSIGVTSCLEGLAAVEASRGEKPLAAQLLGGAIAMRHTYALQLPAAFDLIRQRITEEVKSGMAESEFSNWLTAGEAAPPEHTIRLAMGTNDLSSISNTD